MGDADSELRKLEARARRCRRCALHRTRSRVVFGSGPSDARVMLVGEAPGRMEDLAGLPFVGAAGKRLNRLLEVASLKREDVYITNVVLCRPPGNRRPRREEVEACRGFLQERMAIITPEIVVALGKTAAEALLGRNVSMERQRGRCVRPASGSFRLLITYHPAAALYRGSTWRRIVADFKKLGAIVRRSSRGSL
jgi:uracil-DNA glycosylase family 4